MKKITKVRHVIAGIALSAAGASQGAFKSAAEANEFFNREILPDGYHEVRFNVLRSTHTESGDPAFVQNEYLFIQYEEDEVSEEANEPVKKVSKAKKEEPVPA